jgi:hypothetical protein
VLEAIAGLRRRAFDEQNVGLGEPLQRRVKSGLVEVGDSLEQRVREVAPKHGADLRDLPRGAEPVETCRERLLQGRRDRLRAALDAALQEEARDLLDEQRHAAGALADPFDDLPGQRMTRGEFADHPRDLRAIERGQ